MSRQDTDPVDEPDVWRWQPVSHKVPWIVRLACWMFGHEWEAGITLTSFRRDTNKRRRKYQYRTCVRCGKVQARPIRLLLPPKS